MRYLAITFVIFWFEMMIFCAIRGFILGMVICILAMIGNSYLFKRTPKGHNGTRS